MTQPTFYKSVNAIEKEQNREREFFIFLCSWFLLITVFLTYFIGTNTYSSDKDMFIKIGGYASAFGMHLASWFFFYIINKLRK